VAAGARVGSVALADPGPCTRDWCGDQVAGPVEVVTDRAPAYPQIIDEMAPAARHVTEPYANNSIEARPWTA